MLLAESILSVVHETGQTSDARLVALRYAPDGSRVWRWEREREPVMPWMQYSPGGTIAAVGDRVLVLERAWDEPTRLIELDVHGNAVSEINVDLTGDLRIDQHAIARDGGGGLRDVGGLAAMACGAWGDRGRA